MSTDPKAFIEYAHQCQVLRFGDFTLKSGRHSPYFFNTGRFNSGDMLARLGPFYAQALVAAQIKIEGLFGPAYKGIPLVTSTAVALATHHNRPLPYTFNRKEPKKHAEGGLLVGAPLQGRICIIDDVISAGRTVGESIALIRDAGAEPAALLVALNRQEQGPAQDPQRTAAQEISATHNIPVISIITLADIIAYLTTHPDHQKTVAAMQTYQQQYGATAPTP